MNYQHTDTNLPIESEYPKLVRDRIPEIIQEHYGQVAVTKVMNDDKEFLSYVLKKVVEEAKELSETTTDAHLTEEIADVYEVIDTLLRLKGISFDEVKAVQAKKRTKRGGFNERLVMIHKNG